MMESSHFWVTYQYGLWKSSAVEIAQVEAEIEARLDAEAVIRQRLLREAEELLSLAIQARDEAQTVRLIRKANRTIARASVMITKLKEG